MGHVFNNGTGISDPGEALNILKCLMSICCILAFLYSSIIARSVVENVVLLDLAHKEMSPLPVAVKHSSINQALFGGQ